MAANVRITQVLLKRGNTAAASNYTGPVGEVVIDTGLQNLRIQDGVTAGGHLLSGTGGSSYGNAEVKTYLGQFNGNITPNSNVTYSLGDSTHRWKELWLSGNTIHLGGATINVDNGNLAINGTQVSATLNSLNLAISSTNSNVATINTAWTANARTQQTQIANLQTQISTISLTPGPQGNVGAQGTQGIQGNAGPQGIQGIQGIQGNTGAQGISVTLVGNVSVPEDLTFSGNAGEAYIVNSTGNLYFWNTGITSWVDIGPIVGPEGPRGSQGIQGNTGSQGIQGIQGNVGPQGIQGNVGPGVPVGGTAGQVLAKVDGDDYNTEWVDQTGGTADTGSFGFAGTVIYNKDDYNQGLYIAPGGESTSYVYVPGNSESDSTPVQITNTSASGQIRLQAQSSQWTLDANGAITFPDSTVQTTAFTGGGSSDRLVNGEHEVVLSEDGDLGMPDDSELWFNYGYVGQSANIQNNALRVSGGNAVVINTGEDNVGWQFTADGNLVLPTVVDFMSSPAGYLSGNIVFGDGTVQNSAAIYTGNTAPAVTGAAWYNTEDGRLYVNANGTWQDASPTAIPGNMVAYESSGNIELNYGANVIFPDGTAQTTAFDTHAGNTAPVAGLVWYNTDDGRTYNRVNGLWVDASPAVLPGDIVTFNDSGNITLPVGGQVTWANGRSILHGITASTANTGDVTFIGRNIIGTPNQDLGGFGQLNFAPSLADYRDEKWARLRTGVAEDESHIHFDTSNNDTYDLFLGDDWRYVKNSADGNIYIRTSSGDWMFDYVGTLTTNGSIFVNGESRGLIVDAGGDKRFGFMKYYGIEGALTHNSSVPIRIGRTLETDITQASASSFTTEIYVATDGKVGIANVAPAHRLTVGGDIYTAGNIVFADGTVQTTAGGSSYGNTQVAAYLSVYPQAGTYSDSNVAEYLVANPQASTYSNSNVASYLPTYSGNIAGNIAKNGHTWTFAEDGITTFPSNTIKTAGSLAIQTLSSTPSSVADWNGGGGWNQGFYANLVTTGGTGTGLTVDVTTDGSGYIDINAITINTPGSGYTDGDVITIENENTLTGTFTVGVTANNWTLDAAGELTFPDSTVQTTAWTGILPSPTYSGSDVIGNVDPAPLNLNNSGNTGELKTQLTLINTAGGGGTGSAIDFFTYTDAGQGFPGARLQSVDDANYSSNFSIVLKEPGNGDNNAGAVWAFGSDRSTTFPDQGAVTITGNLTVDGITAGNILPAANVTYNLGSPTQQWNSLYVSSDTIYLGGVPLSVSDGTLLVNSSPLNATTGAVTFNNNKLTGGSVGQVGAQVVVATSATGDTLVNSNGITLMANSDTEQIVSGWTAIFNNGGSRTVTTATTSSGNRVLQINTSANYQYPIIFRSPDYAPGEMATLQLTPNAEVASSTWSFYGNGNVQFPDSTVQTTAYVKTTGTWAVTTGNNTYSFTVPINGVYQLWVRGNIPNGIITYSATAVVTNPNVPVLGNQSGWYYEAGNALVLTSIPAQFVGTDNTISNASPSVGTTTNVFEFGITNNSGSTQEVEWGYTKL